MPSSPPTAPFLPIPPPRSRRCPGAWRRRRSISAAGSGSPSTFSSGRRREVAGPAGNGLAKRSSPNVAAGKRTIDLVRHALYPYQQEVLLFLAFTELALLADEMGLGKTVQAIAACELLRRLRGVERVLVVSPVSLKAEWEDQIGKFTGLSTRIIACPRGARLRQYRERSFFYLSNYEQILSDGPDIERLVAPDVVILDEAQRIKNWRTKTAQDGRLCPQHEGVLWPLGCGKGTADLRGNQFFTVSSALRASYPPSPHAKSSRGRAIATNPPMRSGLRGRTPRSSGIVGLRPQSSPIGERYHFHQDSRAASKTLLH
ncbi:MAG: hypothetical protein GEU28_14525 [Dehalococcoidia bacterium]|nr:hypothetical protein [Dehalococcoidia bacterium]